MMGLQDVFFKKGLPFDSPAARELSKRSAPTFTFMHCGPRPNWPESSARIESFAGTRAAQGELQFDLWDEGAARAA